MKGNIKSRIAMLTFAIFALSTFTSVALAAPKGRPGSPIVIYVTGQELYYDSVAGPALPWKEKISHTFQKLEGTPPDNLWTEYGPGDTGYVGGRWWIDDNGNGYQDAADVYFVCPLLGPGRESP
jgi:hypothetical protein